MPDPSDPAPARWTIAVDLRDILFVAGGGLVALGGALVHPALAVVAIGAGLCWLAKRLARPS